MYDRPIFMPKLNVFFYNILTGGIIGVFLSITELVARGFAYVTDSNIFAFMFTNVCGFTLTFTYFFNKGSIK